MDMLVPPTQGWPLGQVCPQPPQLLASVPVRTHTPPQEVAPAVRHTQTPDAQS